MSITNHEEAFQLACVNPEGSNLARAYTEARAVLDAVWHCMNDDPAPDFPMREIEKVLGK